MKKNALFIKNILKLFFLVWILGISFSSGTNAQTIDWPKYVSGHDLIWENNVDSIFYHGAFIGNGVQGAMIMQDNKNKNGLRMLMGHYKAIAHYSITGFEYCDPRVYTGNITLTPVGKTASQTMQLKIWDGEVKGVIQTDKGKINWNALAERKHGVFIVTMECDEGEIAANLGVREEWGITTLIYHEKKNVNDYAQHLPPKPTLSKQGQINIITQKLKISGAHVVAYQLVKISKYKQLIYVSIATNDGNDVAIAAEKATKDAIMRINAAIAEGASSTIERHHLWWNNYMRSSYLEIKEDPYWQQFWWIQMYKFASVSSESSDCLIDTQGPWMWQCGWAALVWNLNMQLSYYPMYSANKLQVGRSLIRGIDRIYKSGAFRENAKSDNSPGITVPRISSYDGKGTWCLEYGNMPWILNNYWKYWKYSGNDTIGRSLFPILKDNVVYLLSKLKKDKEGIYHLDPSISPEYDEELHPDANYSLSGVKWALQTILSMNKELNFHDSQKGIWQETLDHLAAFPADINGLRLSADQGFDKCHRHYSHLLAIYPYHLLSPTRGAQEKDLIVRSVDRWQKIKGNDRQGYTYTGGCAMYATLGDGNMALETLDKMRRKLPPNTIYSEGGGQVIESPLSAVESINYMLIQSWNDTIRLFPAVPSRWKNISFRSFRTQGAFLVSASRNDSVIHNVTLTSERGKICNLINPWKGQLLTVKDDKGKTIKVTRSGERFTFHTQVGKTYTLAPKELIIKN